MELVIKVLTVTVVDVDFEVHIENLYSASSWLSTQKQRFPETAKGMNLLGISRCNIEILRCNFVVPPQECLVFGYRVCATTKPVGRLKCFCICNMTKV